MTILSSVPAIYAIIRVVDRAFPTTSTLNDTDITMVLGVQEGSIHMSLITAPA